MVSMGLSRKLTLLMEYELNHNPDPMLSNLPSAGLKSVQSGSQNPSAIGIAYLKDERPCELFIKLILINHLPFSIL